MSFLAHQEVYNVICPPDGMSFSKDAMLGVVDDAVASTATNILMTDFSNGDVNNDLIRDMEFYCLRDTYTALIKSSGSSVPDDAIVDGYNELCDMSAFLALRDMKNINHTLVKGPVMKAVSELAVLTTLYGALVDGYFDSGFAYLGDDRGSSSRTGLKNDINLKAKLGKKRVNVKVTTKLENEGQIYDDGIVVVSSQRLASAIKPGSKDIVRILHAHADRSNNRFAAYQELSNVLTPPKKPKNKLVPSK